MKDFSERENLEVGVIANGRIRRMQPGPISSLDSLSFFSQDSA